MIAALAILFGLIAAWYVLQLLLYQYRNKRAGRAVWVVYDARLKKDGRRSWREARRELEAELSIFDKLNRALFGAQNSPSTKPTNAISAAATPLPPAIIDYEDERVPGPAKDRIRRIHACLQQVEAAMERETIPGFSRVDVEQMRSHHLPKLVKSYIDIPALHRSEIFRKTGKSASFILNESLDKMQSRIDEILRNLAQHDIDAFTQNTQFIGQRYADEDNPFL
ncbi:hypothetical protein [Sphingobium sp. MP9-4]|uniref:hypothetical protein n=1 Tax=Sphingobium sp. MP9-4 TaxID=1761936 RepID=UPI001F109FA2|nr:hypothetical protein [Sphingobium sp. MP9-4]